MPLYIVQQIPGPKMGTLEVATLDYGGITD